MATYTLTTLDDPSATGGTFAQGINDSGQVVGYYDDSHGSHGFLLNGNYSIIACTTQSIRQGTNGYNQGQSVSAGEGINDSGQIAGSGFFDYSAEIGEYGGGASEFENFDSAYDGFSSSLTGGSWSEMQAPINGAVIGGTPSSVKTYAYGINSEGDVVGYYVDGGGSHGFLDPVGTTNPNIQEFNYPGVGGATYARGINDQEQIVGYFIGSDPNQPNGSTAHGFLYDGGAFFYFDDPNAVNGTYAEGINNLDEIVGYYVDGNAITHGFIFNQSTGAYTTVDVTGARSTFLTGINNTNELAGYYVDGSGKTHGFIATPPNPPSPAGTTANLIMSNPGNGDYEIYNVGGNRILSAYALGQVGAPWSFVGMGAFQAGDDSDMLLRNASTGQFEAYYINNNNITGSANVGTVGTDWNFSGTGAFDGQSSLSELLLRNSGNGAFELYQVAGGGVLSGSSVAAVGSNFTVEGFGHFSESSTTQMLMEGNSGGSLGQLELYTYDPGSAAFAGIDVGKVGSNLSLLGCADLLGNGSTQMVMQQDNGNLWLYSYDPSSNALSGTEVGAVGGNFHVVGFGPLGTAGQDEMLMQNAAGAFEVYRYNAGENAFDGGAMGAVGAPWVVDGIAGTDPPANSARGNSTAQLVQAMASMSNGAGIGAPADFPAGLQTTASTLLAPPQHA